MESQKKQDQSREQILIVEDSLTQAERLKYILEHHGYQYCAARNGREALACISERRPTLVISDVVMPEMNGYELCRHIKKQSELKNVPVILLTSLSDPVDVVNGLECGADSFIFKPYDEHYLLARVAYVLANRHLRESDSPQMGVEIFFSGKKFFITSDRLQILNLLLSTYEAAVQRNQELSSARDQLRELNDTLADKVRERTAALQEENLERRRAEEEVRRLNRELEQRVLDRTAELQSANAELEAFSYSVSHDLRAPLRHIDGFASLLSERAENILEGKDLQYLRNISLAAKQMGCLIDDLLSFSRMGRAEMMQLEVDFNLLVKEIVKSLQPDADGRQIQWKIAQLPTIKADPSMMRQVLVNLLGNAVKYSRTREVPVIEVGVEESAREAVFFVRDNGVGFDTRYSDKLFRVFQRLHSQHEFEGTGIGLANVGRIIARHGGRVWAESTLGSGATFYFSLPKSCSGDSQ